MSNNSLKVKRISSQRHKRLHKKQLKAYFYRSLSHKLLTQTNIMVINPHIFPTI